MASLWARIGGARLILNDPCGAVFAYRTAVDIHRDAEGEESYQRGVRLIQLGGAAEQCGESQVATTAFEEAIRVLQTTGDPPTVGDAHLQYASVLTLRREHEAARMHLDQALSLFEQHEPQGLSYIQCQMLLAEWFLTQDREAEAEEAYRLTLAAAKGLGPDHDLTVTVLGMLGTLAGERGDLPTAISYLDQVLTSMRRRYGSQSVITARALLWKAAAVQRNFEFNEALTLSAEALQIELDAADALLPAMSEAEGIEFIQSVYLARDFVLSNLRRISDADPVRAYEYVRRSRGLVSRFAERYRQAGSRDPEWSRIAGELQAVRAELGTALLGDAADHAAVARLQERKESLKRRLRQRSDQLNVRSPTQVADLDSTYAGLGNSMAVVELLRSVVPDNEGHLYDAFVVRRDPNASDLQVAWIPLGAAQPIDAAIRAWQYSILGARGVDPPADVAPQMDQATQALRRHVWLPLEPSLRGVEHVIVVPDAALGRLAWGALPDAEPGHVLLERFTFSELTSSAVLQDIFKREQRPVAARSVVLVGGVHYGVDEHGTVRPSAPQRPYLPGTADEVRSIAALLPADWPHTLLTEAGATPEAVRAQLQSAHEVVLSTHGYFDDKQGWGAGADASQSMQPKPRWLADSGPVRPAVRSPLALCGLLLSPTTTVGTADSPPEFTEGQLTGEMLAQLDLSQMNLAVLSACESGLGESSGGEGVFGLQRAFELAGARATVASLWKVPDATTQQLMTRFFENRWQRGMGNAAALREAQLWIRNGGQRPASEPVSPYYWGAFMLTGDWR